MTKDNDDIKNTTLLECPFCGGTAKYWPRNFSDTYGWYEEYVSCSSCSIRIGDPCRGSVKDVIQKWNKRAKIDSTIERGE